MNILLGSIIIGPITIISIFVSLLFYFFSIANKTENEENENPTDRMLINFFRCLGKLAKSDGCVSPDEINFIKNLINRLDCDKNQIEELKHAFNYGRSGNESFNDHVFNLKTYFPGDSDDILKIFFDFACIDSNKIHYKCKMLITAGTIFGNTKFIEFVQNFLNETNNGEPKIEKSEINIDAYKILNVSPTANNDEIKAAYRRKIRDFHPDNILSKELSQEFIEFAKEQTQTINDAYSKIKQERGIK